MTASAVAERLRDAFASRQIVPPPTNEPGFDLAAAYAVERELARMRRDSGHASVGRKVGFASKALWRVLKLDTLVWAHMYDDTVHEAASGNAALSIARMIAPKIEPEIVMKLKAPLAAGVSDPAAVLAAVDWIAIGFEIIDCPYPDWKFQPADFVAAFGLHAALVVGAVRRVDAPAIPMLVDELASFRLRLLKNGELVEEGNGRNALRSPALSLAELASAAVRHGADEPLAASELISTGTLTSSLPVAAGEVWRAEVSGTDLEPLTVSV